MRRQYKVWIDGQSEESADEYKANSFANAATEAGSWMLENGEIDESELPVRLSVATDDDERVYEFFVDDFDRPSVISEGLERFGEEEDDDVSLDRYDYYGDDDDSGDDDYSDGFTVEDY